MKQIESERGYLVAAPETLLRDDGTHAVHQTTVLRLRLVHVVDKLHFHCFHRADSQNSL